MGFRDMFRSATTKRAALAADQMYSRACVCPFEVPLHLSKDSVITQAVLLLQKKYPDVHVMYQSTGIVIARMDPQALAAKSLGFAQLWQYGYFPDKKLTPEQFSDQHREFITTHTKYDDPAQAEKVALQRQSALNAVNLTADKAPEAPTATEVAAAATSSTPSDDTIAVV